MSLLMDALKKAEQEKKEAAKKRDSLEDSGIHLQQSDADITDPHKVVSTDAPGPTSAETDDKANESSSLDLSLAPIDPSLDQPIKEQKPDQRDGLEDQNEEKQALNIEASGLTPDSQTPELQPISPDKIGDTSELDIIQTPQAKAHDPDQTFHGVGLEESFSSELFEETVQGEPFKPEDSVRSYDETLPGVPAAQLAKDIGTQDQPTPVAAQTIFTATSTIAKPSSGFGWLLISLAFVAVGSAVIFYYYSVTPVSRDIPSPLVARGVETIISSSTNNIALPEPALIVNDNIPQQLTAENDGVDGQTDIVVEDDSPLATEGSESVDSESLAGTDVDPGLTDATVETGFQSQDPERLPDVIEPPPSLIKITRSQKPTEENVLVQEAFTAYRAGDYSQAEVKYQQAFEQSADNRDVILGLAAIATRNGERNRAFNL